MQDRINQVDKTSCTARPDHTVGQNPNASRTLVCQLPPTADIRRRRCNSLRHALVQQADAGRMYAHFRAIVEATGLPVILYDVPSHTVCGLVDETVARLAELPRVIGLKDATGDLSSPRVRLPLVELQSGPKPTLKKSWRASPRNIPAT
jgi:hypothetical protein